eukprot:459379_1
MSYQENATLKPQSNQEQIVYQIVDEMEMKSNVPQTAKKQGPIQTNEHGQAIRLDFWKCKWIAPQIRTFHITSITFWICFFVWFCTVNIFESISNDLTDLTLTDHQLAGALSVTSTIIFRLIISSVAKQFGSRISYLIVLIFTAISLIALALIQSVIGYIMVHIFIGLSGASFVVTQYHTTRMFTGKIVGLSQAISAGIGNFGGGCCLFIMPLIVNNTSISWRIWMGVLAVILFIFCFIYWFGTYDNPKPSAASISLISIDSVKHIGTVKNTVPDKTVGLFKDAACDYRSWILFLSYAACFGVEITFYLVGAYYFQTEYELNELSSGLIIICWSSINIFARPLGGQLADKYDPRKRVNLLVLVLFLESVFILLFGALGRLHLAAAVIVSFLFSICVQMAEGITFALVPWIQPKSIGSVIGIVGSGGNFGSTFFMFAVFLPVNMSTIDPQWSYVILGIIVMIISLITHLVKFDDRDIRDFNTTVKACFDLENIQTTYKLPQSNVKANS